MLADVIKTFEKIYKAEGERYITDSHVPVDGEYIIVDVRGEEFEILDRIFIKQNKETKEIEGTNQHIPFIRQADYMSKLVDMNKPIDGKKVIHSNNYFTFFIKKENINNGKLNNTIIEDYYNILKNPLLKYTKANAKKLYQELEEKNGKADEKRIEKIEQWIKNNIYDLVPRDSKEKSYLKIFFNYNLEEYRKESEKYILTNIYNSNDFNMTIDSQIYGLPNNNMGLNAKKPYLENKTRKTKVPYLLSQDEVLMQKKFFDYLMNKVSIGKTNIYINEEEDEIKALDNEEMLDENFSGYYLRIKKGKEVEIHDFDTIGLYKPNIEPINIVNALQIEKAKITYGKIYRLKDLKNIINEVFFSKFLTSNYFTEAKDLNINDSNLKKNILLARTTLFNWFYKGNWNNVWKILDWSTLDIIKGSINNGYILKASEQFNLRVSLKSYFEGEENMADVLMSVKNLLREKINQGGTSSIENDKEYYFAVGQLTSYFLSLSRSKKKALSLGNPIINAKTHKRIKEQLQRLYEKYNYDIEDYSKRFKNLYSMVASYEPEGEVEKDLIIAGYLHSNLIYEKSNGEDNEDE